MTTQFAGRCLCGQVRIDSAGPPQMVGHCQCVDCRKSSGTGHSTHVVAMADGVTVTGDVTTYDHPADSGNMVTRAFCGRCGSPAYSLNAAMPGMIFIRASILDDPSVVTPSMVVYASRAPAWDVMDPALPSFAVMPPAGPEATIAAAQSS